jgi:hypothetical protein
LLTDKVTNQKVFVFGMYCRIIRPNCRSPRLNIYEVVGRLRCAEYEILTDVLPSDAIHSLTYWWGLYGQMILIAMPAVA